MASILAIFRIRQCRISLRLSGKRLSFWPKNVIINILNSMLGFCSWIAFQSVAFAMAPKTTEGPVMIRAIRPPPYDNKTALADVLEDKTLNKERIEFMPNWKEGCRNHT